MGKTIEILLFSFIAIKCTWEPSKMVFLRTLEYSVVVLYCAYETAFLGLLLVLSKVSAATV